MRADSWRRRACSTTRAASAFSCSPNRLSPTIARSSAAIAGLTSERSCICARPAGAGRPPTGPCPRTCVGSASRNTEAMNALTSSARRSSRPPPREPATSPRWRRRQRPRRPAAAARDGNRVSRRELAHASTRGHPSAPAPVGRRGSARGRRTKAWTVAYRSSGFFFSAFRTIVSRSPRSDRRRGGSATSLGGGGSASRMASSSAPRESRFSLYGRVPLSSS